MRETTFPYFIKVPKTTNSVMKITISLHGGISKSIFLDHFSLFTITFRPKIVFLDTDSILRVNTMNESKSDSILVEIQGVSH